MWINQHQECIMPLLTYTVGGLNNKETVSASVLAFKFLCMDCTEYIINNPQVLGGVMQIYDNLESLEEIDHQESIIEGVSEICCTLPKEQVNFVTL